jgi:hypothetical protein
VCYHYTNPTETPSFLKASGRRCYLRGKWDRGFEHPASSLTWIINFRTALPFYLYYVCCSLCYYAKDSKGLNQSIQGYSLQPLYFRRVRRHRSACTVWRNNWFTCLSVKSRERRVTQNYGPPSVTRFRI